MYPQESKFQIIKGSFATAHRQSPEVTAERLFAPSPNAIEESGEVGSFGAASL